MRCYYEVLEVQQDVTDEELRKSYRRLALQLHPDKNPDNAEEAKAKFQEIQNAYEVLSDSQERAFYDRNRESILHGEEFGSGPKEDTLHLYKYFTASCYSGFNDSETGFYAVYRHAFESIVAKDLHYMDDELISIPNFGKSDTNLEDVAAFYGYWQSYCTSMSFYWVDKHDIRQAPNRWVEKRIERENKKVRDKAKKEFNEEVRSLVAFVRKRDKRWQAWKKQLEEKVAENARKQAECQRQQREVRQKWMKETYEEQKESLSQYEQQLKEMESEFAKEWGISDDNPSEGEESDREDVELMAEGLYCIACEKLFKSDKAFKNHEQSRKHQEKQAAIATLMNEEEVSFMAQNSCEEHGINEDEDSNSSKEDVIVSSSLKKKKKKRKQNKDVEQTLSDTKSRKTHSRKRNQSPESMTHLKFQDESSEEELERALKDPEVSQNGVEHSIDPSESASEGFTPNNARVEPKQPKSKGKKAKEAKKKAQQQDKEVKVEPTCSVCGSRFESKNKLFAHLKSSGHAAPKTNLKSKSER